MQAAPLSVKIKMTQSRIREWVNYYGEDGVYISFSGGKDSTVLLDIVRQEYPNIPAVFVDVPTQYPELREFVQTFENVEILKPKMTFMQVCEKYGFPLISKEVSERVHYAQKYLTAWKQAREAATDRQTDRQTGAGLFAVCDLLGMREMRKKGIPSEIMDALIAADNYKINELLGKYKKQNGDPSMFNYRKYLFMVDAPFQIGNQCCDVMKKTPLKRYEHRTHRRPFTAVMASESKLRTLQWLAAGCNAFESKSPISNPMAFWTEQDVLLYIYTRNLPICSVYGDVVKDNEVAGQMDLEDLGLFDLGAPVLKTTGCKRTGCMLCGFGCHLEKDGESRFQLLKQTHHGMYKMLDVVKNNGVTFREAIDWTNEHGNLHIRY